MELLEHDYHLYVIWLTYVAGTNAVKILLLSKDGSAIVLHYSGIWLKWAHRR